MESTLWHLDASTLMASFTSTSGGICPVLSTVNMKWSFFFRRAILSSPPGLAAQLAHALDAQVAPAFVLAHHRSFAPLPDAP